MPNRCRGPHLASTDGVPTLNDALAEVYLTNPTLLSERAKLRATDETVPAALSGWRPQVSVTLSPGWGYGNIKDYTDPVGGVQHQDQQIKNDRFEHSETIQISQALYRGGPHRLGCGAGDQQRARGAGPAAGAGGAILFRRRHRLCHGDRGSAAL